MTTMDVEDKSIHTSVAKEPRNTVLSVDVLTNTRLCHEIRILDTVAPTNTWVIFYINAILLPFQCKYNFTFLFCRNMILKSKHLFFCPVVQTDKI